MKIPITDYAYVDEKGIAEDVIRNYDAPFSKEDILDEIKEYIAAEEEDSLVHCLSGNQKRQICDAIISIITEKGYEVTE